MHKIATLPKITPVGVIALASVFISVIGLGISSSQETAETDQIQTEFIELRIYRINDFSKMQAVNDYLKNALMPALGRIGLDRVGVFTNKGDVNDHSIYVLIPYKSVESFANLNSMLAKDEAFQATAESYFDRPLKDPLYSRIESRFMRTFAGMPNLKLPAQSTQNLSRIFELRLYESHTEGHAMRKVGMFNDGEIKIMQDCQMGPVFFGETLIGPDVPNLIYMLSASNEEEHAEHWKMFLKHPEWIRIKDLDQYKDTVSKIRKWILEPTEYSNI